MAFETTQEDFWAGSFGNEYTDRNTSDDLLASSIALFSKITQHTSGIKTAVELGSNIGINLKALGYLIHDIQMQAVEINKKAADECKKIENVSVYTGSIYDFSIDTQYDLAFTRGVLIHIPPEKLSAVYDILYRATRKYILIAEYYNPTPVEINYRGNDGKLFKRDFAGEILDKYKDIELIDYGFCYHRDNNYSTDDITWFFLQKRKI